MTSSHDAEVTFGREVPWGHRNFLAVDTICILKFKMAAGGHLGSHRRLIVPTLFIVETIVIHVIPLIMGH